jgi:hypothetical protein
MKKATGKVRRLGRSPSGRFDPENCIQSGFGFWGRGGTPRTMENSQPEAAVAPISPDSSIPSAFRDRMRPCSSCCSTDYRGFIDAFNSTCYGSDFDNGRLHQGGSNGRLF